MTDSFPVDDFTLDQLEYALGTSYGELDEDGNSTLVGGEFTLHQYLDFMSGYDQTKEVPIDEFQEDKATPIYVYTGDPVYSTSCVIRALVAEIRRMRSEQDNL